MNRDHNWKKQRLVGILNAIIWSAATFFFMGFISSGIYFSVFIETWVAPYYLLELLTLILVLRLIVAFVPPKAIIANNQIQIKHLIPLIDRTVDAEEIVAVKLGNRTRSVVELEEEYFHLNSVPHHELKEFAEKNRIPIKYSSKRGRTTSGQHCLHQSPGLPGAMPKQEATVPESLSQRQTH